MRLEMDHRAATISEQRTLVPNVYTIAFSEQDFPQVQQWGRALAEELCDEAIRHASVQGYSLSGPVRVTFISDDDAARDRKSTRLNSSHVAISYAVFCLKKKKKET